MKPSIGREIAVNLKILKSFNKTRKLILKTFSSSSSQKHGPSEKKKNLTPPREAPFLQNQQVTPIIGASHDYKVFKTR